MGVTHTTIPIGSIFGDWTVIDGPIWSIKPKGIYYLCKCNCELATERLVRYSPLVNGKTNSCGCRRTETVKRMVTHGESSNLLYRRWLSLKQNHRLCDEWENDYLSFRTWAVEHNYNPAQDRIKRLLRQNAKFSPETFEFYPKEKTAFDDLIGKTFGSWTVISNPYSIRASNGVSTQTVCDCVCSCDPSIVRRRLVHHLLHGRTLSCGCRIGEHIKRKNGWAHLTAENCEKEEEDSS